MTEQTEQTETPTPTWQLVIDAADPHSLADFWAEALHYDIEDNSAMIDDLIAQGVVPEDLTLVHRGQRAWASLAALRGPGPRILFQRVPEPKSVKNRLHVDVNVGKQNIRAEVARLVALGGTEGREWNDESGHWVTMTDPEGNEFDVQ